MRQLSLKIEKMSVVAGMLGAPVKLGAADPAPPVGGSCRRCQGRATSRLGLVEMGSNSGILLRAGFGGARTGAPGARFKFLSILPDKLQKRLSARAGFSNNA